MTTDPYYWCAVCHQPIPRIRDQRRSCIGDKRHAFVIFQAPHQYRPHARSIVFMISKTTGFQAVARQEATRHPGILAGYGTDPGQNGESPRAEVTHIADRCRHHIEPRRNWLREQFTGTFGAARLWQRRGMRVR